MKENYLIIGDDPYIKEKEQKKIRDKFLSSEEVDLNYSVYGPEDIENVMDSLGTAPFLAEKRVVVVNDSEILPESSLEAISSYLDSPVKTSTLVLSSDSSFSKNKHYKKIAPKVELIKADTPTPAKIKTGIRNFFKKEGIEVSPPALELIYELKGDDVTLIKAELEKLLNFSGGKKIEVEHVESLVGRSVTETVFKLVDAINAKDTKWALRVLGDLYEQKKQVQEIVGYLGWYIRVMQRIKLLSSRGESDASISSDIGYSPSYARRLISQSKKYPVSRIDKWVSLLMDTDRDIKTGRKEASLAMEMLIVQLVES